MKLFRAFSFFLALTGSALADGASPPFNFTDYFNNRLSSPPILTTTDQVYVNQGGVSYKVPLSTLASFLGITLPTIDLNFAANTAFGQSCISLTACASAVSSGGMAQWNDGHWSSFASNTLRRTDKGVLVEGPGTNYALYSRDLSQSAWTKTNMTAALTATGIDNTANDASTLTATASNATVCQTMSPPAPSPNYGEYSFSIFLKRVTGSGEVDISLEAAPGHTGTEWRTVSKGVPSLSTSYQRFQLTYDAMSSTATICVRLTASGDAVAADFGQLETESRVTSPILTTATAVTRTTDVVTLASSADTLVQSGVATAVIATSGMNTGLFRHQPGSRGSAPIFGNSYNSTYGWQYAANALFYTLGSNSSAAGVPPLAICGSTTAIDRQTSLALPNILGVSWDSSGLSMDCDGGGTFIGPAATPAAHPWMFGDGTSAPYGYISEVKLYNQKLPASTLEALTTYTNKATVTDPVPSSGEWNGYTSAVGYSMVAGGTLPPFNGQTQWGIETGLLSSGVTAPLQTGVSGNMIRFNLFANNCWSNDNCQIGSTGGSERSELDGSTGAGGTAQFAANTDIWISYSFCVEPGAPTTSNWFISGQVHQTINPSGGGSPPLLLTGKIGEFREISFVTDNNQGGLVSYEWPIIRGAWENIVLQMNFDTTGVNGKVNMWRNGAQVVSYTGATGETPTSGTQNYYWKFGLYRSQSPEYSAIRFANMTYSTSSLLSKVSSPDAVPSGYGTTCQ